MVQETYLLILVQIGFINRSHVVVVVVGGGGGVRGFVAVVLDAFVAVFVDPRNLPVEFGQI